MKQIVITGAGKGIGKALVHEFATRAHVNILAISRSKEHLEGLHKECKTTYQKDIQILQADVRKISATQIQTLSINKVDVLINNAGYLQNCAFDSQPQEEMEAIIQTNLMGTIFTIKTFSNLMVGGSHIVNIGSMGGFQGSTKYPGLALYSAAKAAVACLSECLAEEWKTKEIAVNCLALGAVQTEMLTTAFPQVKAPLSPKKMAEFIADFGLNGHQFFNGKVLPVALANP